VGQRDSRPTRSNNTPRRQAAYGPWEFRSEKWELAYIRRIDVTIAALKSAGVPVIWVAHKEQGLGAKRTAGRFEARREMLERASLRAGAGINQRGKSRYLIVPTRVLCSYFPAAYAASVTATECC
jgi:hypothetical protein